MRQRVLRGQKQTTLGLLYAEAGVQRAQARYTGSGMMWMVRRAQQCHGRQQRGLPLAGTLAAVTLFACADGPRIDRGDRSHFFSSGPRVIVEPQDVPIDAGVTFDPQWKPRTTDAGATDPTPPTSNEAGKDAGSRPPPPPPPTGPHPTRPPCDVEQVLQSACLSCHGAQPVGGAVRLTSLDDWKAPTRNPKFSSEQPVYETARQRIEDGSMPPEGVVLDVLERRMLLAWLGAGVPGRPSNGRCVDDIGPPPYRPAPVAASALDCERPGALPALGSRDQTQCFSFPLHGFGGADDQTALALPPGLSRMQFYYAPPWPADHVVTRFGVDLSDDLVLLRYLAFVDPASTHAHGDIDFELDGEALGAGAQLIGRVGAGECGTVVPEATGVSLPEGGRVVVQWQLFNYVDAPVTVDGSATVCTVPATAVEHVGSMTFLGTENLTDELPGSAANTQRVRGLCRNDSGQPVTVVAWAPYMNRFGVRLQADLVRTDGSMEALFELPYALSAQRHLDMEVTVAPGQGLQTTCTYQRFTSLPVTLGPTLDDDVCYQVVLAYPAGRLDRRRANQFGSMNNCW